VWWEGTNVSTIYGIKKTTRRREKEKKRKRKEKMKRKRRNQREIMTNYFLLQRTGLEICK
jgi:hypothetical protein